MRERIDTTRGCDLDLDLNPVAVFQVHCPNNTEKKGLCVCSHNEQL